MRAGHVLGGRGTGEAGRAGPARGSAGAGRAARGAAVAGGPGQVGQAGVLGAVGPPWRRAVAAEPEAGLARVAQRPAAGPARRTSPRRQGCQRRLHRPHGTATARGGGRWRRWRRRRRQAGRWPRRTWKPGLAFASCHAHGDRAGTRRQPKPVRLADHGVLADPHAAADLRRRVPLVPQRAKAGDGVVGPIEAGHAAHP